MIPSPPPSTPDHAPLFTPGPLALLALGTLCALLLFTMRRRLLAREAFILRARAASTIPPARWMLAALVGWITWVFTTATTIAALTHPDAPPSLALRALATLPGYLVSLTAIVITLWPLRRNATAAGFRIRPRDPLDACVAVLLGVPIVLAVGVLAVLVAELFARATGAPPPDTVGHETLREILAARDASGLSWWILPVALQVVILAPFFEESLYRGCIQSAFLSASQRPWLSILTSSALFALVHFWAVPWHALPTLFAVGVVCAVTFERTGRILPSMLFHAAFNALNLALALWTTP